MLIRRLAPPDASIFQTLRLDALGESSSSFGSSYEEEVGLSIEAVESKLQAKPDRGIWGAFRNETLIGTAGLARENLSKLSHRANLWGMYVAPQERGKGIARELLLHVLEFSRTVPGIKKINLSVNAANTAAIKLYESAGFTSFGVEHFALMINGESHDEVHMYLRLG